MRISDFSKRLKIKKPHSKSEIATVPFAPESVPGPDASNALFSWRDLLGDF
jgi:hypothetical protein